jgi:hypothetical protein
LRATLSNVFVEIKIMRVKTLMTIGAMAVFSFSALADDGNDNNNNSSLGSSVIGSATGLTIGGITSAGAPWVVSRGQASVSGNGRIRVEVRGLLLGADPSLPPGVAGTTGPVTMVGATLVCGGAGGAVVPEAVAVTPSPLSLAGNARIDQDVTLPAACFGPVVLVRIFNTTSTALGSFIAATGLTPNAAQTPNQDSSDHGGDHGN